MNVKQEHPSDYLEVVERRKQDEARRGRHYEVSRLPVFRDAGQENKRQDILLALYAEICSSWRMLTDVRFKLLGFVPTISVFALIGVLSPREGTSDSSLASRIAICMFGFVVTIALYIYDRRNSELHDDLISRGRKIEDELGIDTGQFRGRRTPAVSFVNHSNAVNLIYGTAIVGWLFAAIANLRGWI